MLCVSSIPYFNIYLLACVHTTIAVHRYYNCTRIVFVTCGKHSVLMTGKHTLSAMQLISYYAYFKYRGTMYRAHFIEICHRIKYDCK